jgi:hypothetical protein
MLIMPNGVDYTTGRLLVEPLDEVSFGDAILSTLTRNAEEVARLARFSERAASFRGEVERIRRPDLGDPLDAGWTFLVSDTDPRRDDIIEAIRPLAEHRGMADPQNPLVFHGEPPLEWGDWLTENYSPLETDKLPYYILILGGPQEVPFHFQALLDGGGAVGRLAFDTIDDLKAYVDKVIRLEKAARPVTKAEIVFFATDAGERDPTYFSRRYMVEPLAEEIKCGGGFETTLLAGDDATKAALADTLSTSSPALVYTASHGVGAVDQPQEMQESVNGAICCQDLAPGGVGLFTAADVPQGDKPFLEGAVFFQFACFGYGTPAESDFDHWIGGNGRLSSTKTDFVAALPKRLLAHPRGPIGFIGHVDLAWMHGFTDPDNPHLIERWHPRVETFVAAVRSLIGVEPAGLALERMNRLYNVTNAMLANAVDRMQRPGGTRAEDFQRRVIDTFVLRSDAQNYHVFGDPAARLSISKP